MKIWFLTNAPSPYQMRLISAVQKTRDVEVDIRLMRCGYDKGAWKSVALPPHTIVMKSFIPESFRDEFRFHCRAVMDVLRSEHDLYILSGLYSSPTFIICAYLLQAKRLPWCAWLERPWPEDYTPSWSSRLTSRHRVLRKIRLRLLKSIVHMAPGIMCIGSAAMDAYESYGAKRENLVYMPYICDTQQFENIDEETIEALKTELGLNNRIVFLYCGSLIRRKGVDVLLAAFQRIASEREDPILLIVGDGDDRNALELNIKTSLKDKIIFVGQIDQEKLPQYYLSADVFVFPSRYDGWGVVVNEACAAGLPVITTDTTGASRDLIKDGHNGFVLNADDENGFYNKMMHFISTPEDILKFGNRSLEMIQPLTLSEGVERFMQAVKKTYNKRKNK